MQVITPVLERFERGYVKKYAHISQDRVIMYEIFRPDTGHVGGSGFVLHDVVERNHLTVILDT